MKKDIQNRDDIAQIVTAFYDRVRTDDVIGFFFTDVIPVDWDEHIPVMVDFWENTIFHTGTYQGNPMAVHIRMNKLHPTNAEHFKRWTELLTDTVDQMFTGEHATLMKQRALSIANIMQGKIIENELLPIKPR